MHQTMQNPVNDYGEMIIIVNNQFMIHWVFFILEFNTLSPFFCLVCFSSDVRL